MLFQAPTHVCLGINVTVLLHLVVCVRKLCFQRKFWEMQGPSAPLLGLYSHCKMQLLAQAELMPVFSSVDWLSKVGV